MKTLNCSSRFAKGILVGFAFWGSVAQAAGPLLFPGVDGDLRTRVSPGARVWTDFWHEGFLAATARVSLHDVAECAPVLKRFESWRIGTAFVEKKPDWKPWEPWSKDDRKIFESCSKFPCGFKLDKKETALLIESPQASRSERYLSLVRTRVQNYVKTGQRLPYRFAGDLVDPIEWFRVKEIVGKEPVSSGIYSRKFSMVEGKLRPLRQVLEQRTYRDERGVQHLIRDAYTAHYFDGWGERVVGECVTPTSFRLVQILFMEFDQFKKKDVLTTLARPKMKTALEEQGLAYLEARESRLK